MLPRWDSTSLCTAVNTATDTPPDSSKATVCLQPKQQPSLLTKNNVHRSNSWFFLLASSGLWLQWKSPLLNQRVLNHKRHDKSGDLWTVKGMAGVFPPSCEHLVPARQHFIASWKQYLLVLAQEKNFNSPGNQQDAITPAIWGSFARCPLSHRQQQLSRSGREAKQP